jgi:ABC-2 type transport system ATP-binding protein
MILKLNQEQDTTVLISSHNLNYTTDISSHVVLLERGIVKKDLSNSVEARAELNEYFILQAM